MLRLKFYLTAVLCGAFVLGTGQGELTTRPPTLIPVDVFGHDVMLHQVDPETSKTPEPPTTPTLSTTAAPTPTAAPTSTPAPDTTSTPKPTPPPTPEPSPPTTTTLAPPTPEPTPKPTPPSPTPAPAPKPVPSPDKGTWMFTNDKNVTCILVQFGAQLNVTYTKLVENKTSLAYVLVNVPANASVADGNCTGAEQWMRLSWPAAPAAPALPNNLTLIYHSNASTNMYSLFKLHVALAPEMFPNASSKDAVELWHGVEWTTPLDTSYYCRTPVQLNMTVESTSSYATLTLSRLQEQAFKTSQGDKFSSARECAGGDLPDAVPVAVGCALGGLVLVVLVAYLVARRRSAARGYLSM